MGRLSIFVRRAWAGLALSAGLAGCGATAAGADTAPLARSPDGRPLVLTFEDNFDSFRRWTGASGVWRTTFRDGRGDDEYELRTLKWNKELELYADPDLRPRGAGPSARPLGLDPFSVADGQLTITAQPVPPETARQMGGFRYASGLITTQPTFAQTYGYFEIRAKIPRGKGVWPAFWLLPLDLDWPPEIDVMESVGDPAKVYVTAHSKLTAKDPGTAVDVAPDAFHTYAVSWDPKTLIWFVDGREVKRLPTPPDMHKPMYMLANLALGGDWAGAPDASTPFPARYVIDHIRAYRFAS